MAATRPSERRAKVSRARRGYAPDIYDDVLINFLPPGQPSAPIDENIFGMTSEWIVVITICTLLMLLACGVGIGICICRKKTNRRATMKGQTSQLDANGSKHLNFYRPAVLGEFAMLGLCNWTDDSVRSNFWV